MTYIGIDTGVHTGFAVWHSDTKYLAEVSTMTITQAMERVKMISDIRGKDSIRLFIEDARQRKWFGNTGRERWVLTVVGILFAGWICYGISWLIEVIIPPYPGAYYYTCFETEAYNHEDDPDYLKRRIPFWGWISCIPNWKVKHKKN